MLRITIQPTSHGTTLKVEGQLGFPWVQKLERLWERVRDHALHHALRIDLTSVLFVDAEGTRILKQMHNDGAELTSEAFQTKSLVEEVTGLKTATEGSKRRRTKVRRKRMERHLQHSTP
jgi:anti-anti-sigma regulatory factor